MTKIADETAIELVARVSKDWVDMSLKAQTKEGALQRIRYAIEGLEQVERWMLDETAPILPSQLLKKRGE